MHLQEEQRLTPQEKDELSSFLYGSFACLSDKAKVVATVILESTKGMELTGREINCWAYGYLECLRNNTNLQTDEEGHYAPGYPGVIGGRRATKEERDVLIEQRVRVDNLRYELAEAQAQYYTHRAQYAVDPHDSQGQS